MQAITHFCSFEELINAIKEDKATKDITSRRYPIRLILLDSFDTFRKLVFELSSNHGVDVYDIEDKSCDVVFTNPPYNLMTLKEKDGGSMLKEFLRISKKKVILLLNVFFLSSKERKELLKSSHLRHMYIHSDRVTMYPYGEEKPKHTGTKMFVWLIWDKEYNGLPTFDWI